MARMPNVDQRTQAGNRADVTHASDGAPAVSIVIATYNRSNPVSYAVRSVLAQTRTDWELL